MHWCYYDLISGIIPVFIWKERKITRYLEPIFKFSTIRMQAQGVAARVGWLGEVQSVELALQMQLLRIFIMPSPVISFMDRQGHPHFGYEIADSDFRTY